MVAENGHSNGNGVALYDRQIAKDAEPYWPEGKLRICITGAGGFIASHLARRLKGEGHHIVACDWKRNEHMTVRITDFCCMRMSVVRLWRNVSTRQHRSRRHYNEMVATSFLPRRHTSLSSICYFWLYRRTCFATSSILSISDC